MSGELTNTVQRSRDAGASSDALTDHDGPGAERLRDQGVAAMERIATDRTWHGSSQFAEQGAPGVAKPGDAQFKYDRMFEDGVLDITVGVGLYFGKDNPTPGAHDVDTTVKAIESLGFTRASFAQVKDLYAKTGRKLDNEKVGAYYVLRDAVHHRDASGKVQTIPAVIRLVNDPDGTHGKETAQAFEEGMASSDVAYFSGHCNYGSGPDLDGGPHYKLRDEHGKWTELPGYEALYDALKKPADAAHHTVLEEYQQRASAGTLQMIPRTEGDLELNAVNRSHYDDERATFGAALAYLARAPGAVGPGARQLTGPKGELNTQEVARRYHVWVFDQCRSVEYLPGIRSTPSLGRDNTDVLATRREGHMFGNEQTDSFDVFLTAILTEASAQDTLKGMEAARPSREDDDKTIKGPTMIGSGFSPSRT